MIDFSMLVINSNRSKAYLQSLIKNNFYPKEVLLLQDKTQTLPEQKSYQSMDVKTTKQSLIREIEGINECFDEKEHIATTLKKNNIPYRILNTINVNSHEVVNCIKEISTEYIVYSGAGGYILSEEILSQGKKFIHVHAGMLPEYRGSTTMYYSMLIDSNIGCSVIIMDKEIDKGTILYRKKFAVSNNYTDYDLVFDPIARASTLIDFMKNINEDAEIEKKGLPQKEDGNTFYIIHPVLKHLAILKSNKYIKKNTKEE